MSMCIVYKILSICTVVNNNINPKSSRAAEKKCEQPVPFPVDLNKRSHVPIITVLRHCSGHIGHMG